MCIRDRIYTLDGTECFRVYNLGNFAEFYSLFGAVLLFYGKLIIPNLIRCHRGRDVYKRQTGIVKNVATGKSWVVFAVANAQDNGCGGIVGYQASEYGLQNCFNRATVEKTVKGGSNGVGGMIGRMEVAGSNSYVLDSCKNYGDIYGNQRVGGMVGVWKYYGGTVSNCVNYGKITAKYGEGAAGIIGHFIEATDKVTVLNCQNHEMCIRDRKRTCRKSIRCR